MPADCIKTVLELDPTPEPAGLLAGAFHFLSTGRAMVAKGGPGALFVGMVPRLAEKVGAAASGLRVLACAFDPESVFRVLSEHC